MAIFTGFGPRRAAGLAEQPNFSFTIDILHPNVRYVRVLALNSKILLLSTPFCVVLSWHPPSGSLPLSTSSRQA